MKANMRAEKKSKTTDHTQNRKNVIVSLKKCKIKYVIKERFSLNKIRLINTSVIRVPVSISAEPEIFLFRKPRSGHPVPIPTKIIAATDDADTESSEQAVLRYGMAHKEA